jgi:release factor glutamine methyltransferase
MTTGRDLTLRCYLEKAQKQLQDKGFTSPREEARQIVSGVAHLELAYQLANPDYTFDIDTFNRLNNALALRLEHVPLQQIAGGAWFYDLWFQVSDKVLSPRPETELLVEEAYRYSRQINNRQAADQPIRILDAFTGTGAVGISLSQRLWREGIPNYLVLSDISPEAAKLAESNSTRYLERDAFHVETCDLWPRENGRYDLLTANPPYIPSGEIETLMAEVSVHEPHIALDGGLDGLLYYRRLALEARDYLHEGGALFIEIGAGQSGEVEQLFLEQGWKKIRVVKDLSGHDRILSFCR